VIPKVVINDAAEKAGFGSILRSRHSTSLVQFAVLIAQWQLEKDSAICNAKGNEFSAFRNDFMDGKMDGAYMCAELIKDQYAGS
jgi:hypothetical protein